ncbi:MAG: Spy/CpxP family protein refolding chaperone [Beijerinckiaceae bacterium]
MKFAVASCALIGLLAVSSASFSQQRDSPFKIEPQITITPAPTTSPYVGFETRDVKTLSTERQEGLKRGAGLGYALAAEMNGFPGPQHVLDLADKLELTAEQKTQTRVIFDRMRKDAIAAGEALIAAESHLDRLFQLKQASYARVEAQTAVAAAQEARLRAVHLNAHVAMMEVLTQPQIESYNRLRGYREGAAANPPGGQSAPKH